MTKSIPSAGNWKPSSSPLSRHRCTLLFRIVNGSLSSDRLHNVGTNQSGTLTSKDIVINRTNSFALCYYRNIIIGSQNVCDRLIQYKTVTSDILPSQQCSNGDDCRRVCSVLVIQQFLVALRKSVETKQPVSVKSYPFLRRKPQTASVRSQSA